MRPGLAIAAVVSVGASLIALAAVARAETAERPRPWLGVNINDTDALWGGVAVLDVFDATPASLCGLRGGDEILAVDDVDVSSSELLRYVVQQRKVGARVRIRYVRGGEIRRCRTTLAAQITDPTELLWRRVLDRALPPFTIVQRGDGRVLDDVSTRGRSLVLALFSTACDSCASTLTAIQETVIGDTGVELVAVTADGEDPLDAWIQRHGITVDVGLDQGALVRRFLTDRQDVTLLVVDHEGVVRFAASGAGPEATHLDGAAFCLRRAERARADAD